jgi:CRP-like cAMP-binding protein
VKLLGGGAEALKASMWLAMRWETWGVSRDSLRWASPMESRTFNTGDVIFRQGDAPNGEAYLVNEGAVEVRRSEDGEERILRKLGRGDLLGEVALFRSAPHSATAIAIEPVTALVIPEHRLEYLVRTYPRLALALIRQLARMAAGEEPKPR